MDEEDYFIEKLLKSMGEIGELLQNQVVSNFNSDQLIIATENIKKEIENKKLELKVLNKDLGLIYDELERRNNGS